MSAKGEINLAPYSFFNAVSDDPPIVLFSSEGPKDSLVFVEQTKEFVCNLATYRPAHRRGETSAQFPRGVNEMEQAGLAPAPSPAGPSAARRRLALRARMQAPADHRSQGPGRKTGRTVTSCSDRWSASTSTTDSSRTAGSTPRRCSRSRVAAMPTTPSSTRCSRSPARPRRAGRPPNSKRTAPRSDVVRCRSTAIAVFRPSGCSRAARRIPAPSPGAGA